MDRLTIAVHVVKEAGSLLLKQSPGHVQYKEGRDIATDADLLAQDMMIRMIKSFFPNDLIISEELPPVPSWLEYDVWVLDPLDGTVNYASGIPFWSVSVAFLEKGVPICGAVYIPLLGELYSAEIGKPSLCNGQTIRPSATSSLKDSLVSVVLPSRFSHKQMSQMALHIGELSSMTRGVRVLVSEAAELCFVACGKLDGNYCPSKGLFSAAAGSLIALQAGCRVTDTSGSPYRPGVSRDIIAGNQAIHQALLNYFLRYSADE